MADANAIGKDIAFIKFLSIVTDEIRSGIDNFRRKKHIFSHKDQWWVQKKIPDHDYNLKNWMYNVMLT